MVTSRKAQTLSVCMPTDRPASLGGPWFISLNVSYARKKTNVHPASGGYFPININYVKLVNNAVEVFLYPY